jgi:DNA mismatch repair protein MutS2
VVSIFENTQEIEVVVGRVKLRTGLTGIEKIRSAANVSPARGAGITIPEMKPVSSRLDLRGRRADEVQEEVDRYLNEVSMSNLKEAVIIHGFGTGTVRQIVRDYIASHPLVKSFRGGGKGEGGDGVTVVSL